MNKESTDAPDESSSQEATKLRARVAELEGRLEGYERLYESASAGHFTLSLPEGVIGQLNLTGAGLLGFDRDLLLGRRFGLFVAEGDRAMFAAFLGWVFATRVRQTCEVRLSREEQATRIVAIEAVASRDGRECMAVVSDITGRVESDVRLRSLNWRFTLAVRGAGYGVWEYDLRTERVTWDEQMVSLYGHTRTAFAGTLAAWRECVHPADRGRHDKRLENLLAGRLVERFDFRIVRVTDGRVRHVESSAYLQLDGEGRPSQLVGMSRDVTERREAQEALAAERRLLRTLIDNLPVSVYVKDTEGRYLIHNLPNANFLGTTGEGDIVGRTVYDFFPEELARLYDADDRMVMETGLPLVDREEPYRIGERSGYFLTTKMPLRDDDGKVIGLVGVTSDITERKTLEEQLRQAQKMEVIGQLAGGVAHDFNNMLAVMMLNLEMLRTEPLLPAEVHPRIRELETVTNRAAGLTRQLLLFSRRQATRTARLEVNAALDNLMTMVGRLLGEHVAVRRVSSGEELWTEADPGMLDQVVMNLCLNARDAMPDGGQLTLEAGEAELDERFVQHHPEGRPGRFVCLRVSDTGCGMDSGVLRHLFEPFFTTKGVGRGTGLGLATVHGIVHQHQGWLEVESEVGRGSTFRIYLPVAASPKADRPANLPELPSQGGGEMILLVEDEPSLRTVAIAMLTRLGYRVQAATDGPDALKVWEKHGGAFRLLFTDMMMPGGMSGMELARELQRRDAGLRVVVTSGYSAEIMGGDTPRAAGFGFLGKPYDLKALSGSIRRGLAGE